MQIHFVQWLCNLSHLPLEEDSIASISKPISAFLTAYVCVCFLNFHSFLKWLK